MLLRAPTVGRSGGRAPPADDAAKSTYFFPKTLDGLVFYGLDDCAERERRPRCVPFGHALPDRDAIREALRVIDPELRRDVAARMVREIELSPDGAVAVVALTVPGCPLKEKIEGDVRREAAPSTACARWPCASRT